MITHVDLYRPRERKPYATNVPIGDLSDEPSEVRVIRAELQRHGKYKFMRGTIVKPAKEPSPC